MNDDDNEGSSEGHTQEKRKRGRPQKMKTKQQH